MRYLRGSASFRPRRISFMGLPGLPLLTGAAILLAIILAGASLVSSQEPEDFFYLVQSIDAADLGIEHPAGLAYSERASLFYIFERSPRDADKRTKVVRSNAFGHRKGPEQLSGWMPDPLNLVFADSTNSLYFWDRQAGALAQVPIEQNGGLSEAEEASPRPDGGLGGAIDPQGMAFDAVRERLYVLDAAGPAIAGSALAEAGSSRIALRALAGVRLRGLAYNPADEHLYVMGVEERKLYEVGEDGRILSYRDLSEVKLLDPQGMVFAPSADPTDDPAIMDLYIADGGEADRGDGHGRIVELSFREAPGAPAVMELPASLVQFFDTSKKSWDPSSPDPGGITYVPSTGHLLIADSEVEEDHPDWKGKNLFESTVTGSLVSACDTLVFSKEPTGIGMHPGNGHLYFSDDLKNRVFEVDAVDEIFCNGNDEVTYLDTTAFGGQDVEGVVHVENRLFIIDGMGAEVFVVDLGADGVVGGGDDLMTAQFDTFVLGLREPQGIEYNPERNTLFLISTVGTDHNLVETTLAGTAVYTYDLYFLGNRRRSGLAMAPNSRDPGITSLYLVSRGRDNDANPAENDGRVYELLLGQPDSDPSPTPTPGPLSESIFLPGVHGD